MKRLLSTLCATAALLAFMASTAHAGYFQGTWNTSPLLPATASANVHADSSNQGTANLLVSDFKEAGKHWVWVSSGPGDNPPFSAVIGEVTSYTGGFLNVSVINSSMPTAGSATVQVSRGMSSTSVTGIGSSSSAEQYGDGSKGVVTVGGNWVAQGNGMVMWGGYVGETAKWSVTAFAMASTGSQTLGDATAAATIHSVNPPVLTCNGHE